MADTRNARWVLEGKNCDGTSRSDENPWFTGLTEEQCVKKCADDPKCVSATIRFDNKPSMDCVIKRSEDNQVTCYQMNEKREWNSYLRPGVIKK